MTESYINRLFAPWNGVMTGSQEHCWKLSNVTHMLYDQRMSLFSAPLCYIGTTRMQMAALLGYVCTSHVVQLSKSDKSFYNPPY